MNSTFAANFDKMRRYRPLLDILMGIVYLGLAGLVFYKRSFATIELSSGTVYGMGGLLIVYGLFRIYLGVTRRNA